DHAEGGAQAGPLLLDVRAALLLDEDHPGRARLRRRARDGRAGRAAGRHGGEGGRVRAAGRQGLPAGLANGRLAVARDGYGQAWFAAVARTAAGGRRRPARGAAFTAARG